MFSHGVLHIIFLLVSIYLCHVAAIAQGIRLSLPLAGEPGTDYHIGYYMDHKEGDGIKDGTCGDKTYDGHKGTDFMLRSFKTMDSGVLVYAVADGTVYAVQYGLFDRNKKWKDGGYGNYISILHKGGLVTYYAHLKRNSILVQQGDEVKSGQPIAMVGSSGYSAYPHLHFEAKRGGELIDPFGGGCSETNTYLWNTSLTYDTSLYLIEHGFTAYIPNVDTLQERYDIRDTFAIGKDTSVCFWIQMHGLRPGYNTRVEWVTPKGKPWYQFDYVWETAWWYDYTWFYIPLPRQKGRWTARYYVNNRLVLTDHFYIVKDNSRR